MALLFLVLLLFLLMALVGGERGVNSFVVLIANGVLCVLSVLLLSLGIHPILILAVSSVLFVVFALPFQNGLNQKTLASLLAVLLLMIPVSLAVGFVCAHAHIVGLDEIQIYQIDNSYLSSGVRLNLTAVMLVSLVWGQLGAVIDTSITVASSLNEVLLAHPELSGKPLVHEGLQIGKSIIGTTINTLAFIAFGETILLCLLYVSDGYSLLLLLNSKSFFQQFGGILFSCESCLLVIPLTVVLFSKLTSSQRVTDFFARRAGKSS